MSSWHRPAADWVSLSEPIAFNDAGRIGGEEWSILSLRAPVSPPESISVREFGAFLHQMGVDIAAPRREHGRALLAQGTPTLRALRLAAGFSQQELAERIDTDQPNIARLENGKSNPQLMTLRKLVNALGVDMNTLEKAFPE